MFDIKSVLRLMRDGIETKPKEKTHMFERLLEKLDRFALEAGINTVTQEMRFFAMLVREDVIAQWPQRTLVGLTRLLEKLDRFALEAGINTVTQEMRIFAMLVREDVIAEWPQRNERFASLIEAKLKEKNT